MALGLPGGNGAEVPPVAEVEVQRHPVATQDAPQPRRVEVRVAPLPVGVGRVPVRAGHRLAGPEADRGLGAVDRPLRADAGVRSSAEAACGASSARASTSASAIRAPPPARDPSLHPADPSHVCNDSPAGSCGLSPARTVLAVRVPPFLALDLRLHVDVLGLLEGLEALAAELAAEAGLLEAAEGAGVVVGQRVVDPDGAGAQLAHAADGALEVGGVDVGAEAELGAVGELDRLVERGDGDDRGDRAEGLLAQQGAVGGGAGDDGGGEEVAALGAAAVAADEDLGAGGAGRLELRDRPWPAAGRRPSGRCRWRPRRGRRGRGCGCARRRRST